MLHKFLLDSIISETTQYEAESASNLSFWLEHVHKVTVWSIHITHYVSHAAHTAATCPQTPWSTSRALPPETWWSACCRWSGHWAPQSPGACAPTAAGWRTACTAAAGVRARWRTVRRRGQRAPPRAERSAGCSQSRGGNGGSCTCSASAGRGQSYCTWCALAWKRASTHRPSACR